MIMPSKTKDMLMPRAAMRRTGKPHTALDVVEIGIYFLRNDNIHQTLNTLHSNRLILGK